LETYYKLARTDGFGIATPDGFFTLPGHKVWPQGEWQEVTGKLVPHKNGLHVVTPSQAMRWLIGDMIIYRVEVDSSYPSITEIDKTIVRRARIVEKTRWQPNDAFLLAADYAEQVLPVFERILPGNRDPHQAIEAARNLKFHRWPDTTWTNLLSALDDNANLSLDDIHSAWAAADAAYAAAYGFVWMAALLSRKAGASEQDQVARLMAYL
jgi:hypothetical protein